jgi:hypothetical protein
VIAAGLLGKRPSTNFGSNITRSRASSGSQTSLTTFQEPIAKRLLSLTKSKLDALEQQQAEGEYRMTSDSFISGPESSTHSSHYDVPFPGLHVGLGIGVDEKPLPELPSNHAPTNLGKTIGGFDNVAYPRFDTGRESLEKPSPLGFSFKPGDDSDILTQKILDDLSMKGMTGVRKSRHYTTYSEEQSEAPNTSRQSEQGGRLKVTPVTHKLQSKPSQDIQVHDSLKREDSTSSIITAVRDNSGRSIVDSSRQSSQSMRQRLKTNSGGSGAVTAAVRALASASAGTSNHREIDQAAERGKEV